MTTNPPQNLSEWQLHRVLQTVNLLQYYDNFIREGECDVLKLSNAEDKTFEDVMEKVGMAKKPLHVRLFRNTLIQWVDDPGKNDHVPSYIKKSCDVIQSQSEKKTQNAIPPIPKRRSTIMGKTNNESQNIPAGTSTIPTSRLGKIANTIGFLESQNIPAGTCTVLTSSGGRSASTVGNLESQNIPTDRNLVPTPRLGRIATSNETLEPRNNLVVISTVSTSRQSRIFETVVRTRKNESTQPRISGRTKETPQDQVAVGFRTGDSQIVLPGTSAPLRKGHQETLSSALFSHSTASSQDIMDITRELHGNDTNTHTLNDFLPEIEPFGDVGQNSSVDALKDVLKHYRKLTIYPISEENELLMEVRRGNVLLDAIAIIRISEDDLHNPLRIKFSDEEGEDWDGLRREFWSLLLYNITHSCYVTGKPGRQTFQTNFIERKKNTFFHLGQLIALSILQDGPGLPIFSDIVTDYIMTGKTNVLNIDDLPDGLKTHWRRFISLK
ncbi:NAB [Mytilus coruscus]|uniref:NAB n=1 Tax=Mytilus coruscus TaxID=42192 RepID=A0A6J8BWS8_MYTCO|nr:NAB [Mytilus coruscus]